ncbi:MAG: O-antigen ligase family protein [Acidimicrobiia bacterium]|nr:O-antigen ligase family protein [Acidimicrobiia bacterium]
MSDRPRAPVKSVGDRRQVWALRLLPVTAAVGPTFLTLEIAGAGLFPFRMLVIFLFLATMGSATRWRTRPLALLFLIVGLIWTVWSGLSLWWAPDLNLGIEQTFGIGFGLMVGVVVLNLGLHSESHLDAILEGWMAAYTLSGFFAVRELVTGVYLPGDAAELYGDRAIEGIAISFFDNPNNYAAFILLCVPFMLLGYARAQTKLTSRIALLLLASVPVLVFFTTSRLALIGVFVQFLVFALIGLETPGQVFKYLALATTVVVLIGAVFWSGSRTANDLEQTFNRDYAVTGSDTVRWNLFLNGLWMTWDSGGMGVGAAGYGVTTETEYIPHAVGDITDPHNFWIEILSQHGVLVFVAVSLWFSRVARVAVWARRLAAFGDEPHVHAVSVAILVGLSGYLFASLANSTFISQSDNWMFLASLAALASSLPYFRQTAVRQRILAKRTPPNG